MEMRHLTIAGLAISALGAAAFGASPFMNVDRSNMPVFTANDIGLEAIDIVTGEVAFSSFGAGPRDNFKTTYSSVLNTDGNPWASGDTLANGSGFQTALGGAFFDDFAKVSVAGSRTADALNNIRFVGGASVAGGVLFFDFFDSNEQFVDGFGVQLPQGGAFIWTIGLKPTPEFPDFILKPEAGFLQIAAGENNTAIWFQSELPAIGGNIGTPGAGTGSFDTTVYMFELNNIPTPGALALFGLAGLASARRRRA